MSDAPERIWAVTEPNDISADTLGDVYAQQVPDGMVGTPVEYVRADRIKELEAQNTEAMREAEGLAKAIHRRFYQEQAPQWKPLEYVAGIVSQIDNMTAGMADRIEELEAENRHLRIMLDSYGRLSNDKARLTKLREYIQTKTRATQVKGQDDE